MVLLDKPSNDTIQYILSKGVKREPCVSSGYLLVAVSQPSRVGLLEA